MSRFKRYAHSLLSGYLLLGANIVFTLASVPLAFRYLSKAEFGLWALTAQLAGYIALIDLGMAGVSRILIDYKDQKAEGHYGSVIQTLVWVSLAQGALILLCGVVMAFGLVSLLEVPAALGPEFRGLMIGQSTLLAASFLTRVFGYLLTAHQRYDVFNYAQSFSFAANFAALWLGFHFGQGVYSMLWGLGASWVLSAALCVFWCFRLKLFPPAGSWGRPSLERFWELFAYGRDIFLFFVGGQLVNASQTILLTRMLGLDAAAVWSVCTRMYNLILQMVFRVFDYSCAALAEMIVRQEKERLFRRFKSIVVLSSSLSVAAAVPFAVCNQSFVHVWSSGRIGWAAVNDVLLAVWLVVSVLAYCHVGLVGQSKQFRFLRFIYFLEGLVFVVLTWGVLPWGGVTAMLGVSVVASLAIRLPYAVWRSSQFFELSWKTVAFAWTWPSLHLALWLAPVGAVCWWVTRSWPVGLQLAARGSTLGLLAAVLWLRFGLEENFRAELLRRAPGWLRPGLQFFGQASPLSKGGIRMTNDE